MESNKNRTNNHGDPVAGATSTAPSNNRRTLRSHSEELGSGDAGGRNARRKSSAGLRGGRKGVTFNNYNPTPVDFAPLVGDCAPATTASSGSSAGGGVGFADATETKASDDDAFRPNGGCVNNEHCLAATGGGEQHQPQSLLHTIDEGVRRKSGGGVAVTREKVNNSLCEAPGEPGCDPRFPVVFPATEWHTNRTLVFLFRWWTTTMTLLTNCTQSASRIVLCCRKRQTTKTESPLDPTPRASLSSRPQQRIYRGTTTQGVAKGTRRSKTNVTTGSPV